MLIMARSVQELIFHRDTVIYLKEVSSGTISENGIFGNGNRLNEYGNLIASREACKTNATM